MTIFQNESYCRSFKICFAVPSPQLSFGHYRSGRDNWKVKKVKNRVGLKPLQSSFKAYLLTWITALKMVEESTFITVFRVLTLFLLPLISRTPNQDKLSLLKKEFSFRTFQLHQVSPDTPFLNRSRQCYLMAFQIRVRATEPEVKTRKSTFLLCWNTNCGPLTFCFLKIYLGTKFVELHTCIISLRIDFLLTEIRSQWFQTASRLGRYNLRLQFWISSLNVCMNPGLQILILCNVWSLIL